MKETTKENIKATIRLLGFLTLVAIFIAFIKHADTLAECVIEDDNGTVIHIGIYGSTKACSDLKDRIRPWERIDEVQKVKMEENP